VIWRRLITTRRGLIARGQQLSLRARLLAGLVAVIAVFLIVMGTVSIIVLGTLEQDQFNANLRLAGRQSVPELVKSTDGYSAVYLALGRGKAGKAYQAGELTADSPATSEMRDLLRGMTGQTKVQVIERLTRLARRGEPFSLQLPGQPPMLVTWRVIPPAGARASGVLPAGEAVILVGRPTSAIGSQVRGLVLAELITGAALLAFLAFCGNWLIGRGLAPLGRMARTADLITGRDDLSERMPVSDNGDRHEAGRLAAAINTMLDRIQLSFAARQRSEEKVRQFAADASHEMRTPLTTIRGYAELYRQGAIAPDELPNAMRRIEQEADRMSRLVAELLELARLDRTSSLDLTETDLGELARDAVADALAVEPERPIRVDIPGAPMVVTADEPRLRQVLANLLGNVREHTPPGTPATVALRSEGDGAQLEVIDDGPGMSAADAARAFDRFHRGARPGELEPGATIGSGLGLSIVQAIAAAHGGYARLRSAPGSGTTVQVWIPVKARAGHAKRSSGPASPSTRLAADWPARDEAPADPQPATSP
jgi:two-component system OmpR family sensor kinase